MTQSIAVRLVRLVNQPAGHAGQLARAAPAALPLFLLHGEGGSRFDELFIFGGFGLVIVSLVFLSWRAGRQRQGKKSRRRRKQ